MNKPTPGPWVVNDMATNYVVHSKDRVQARTDYHGPEDAANAQLMASSPDMAATLELIVRYCEAHQDGADLKWIYDTAVDQLLKSIGGRLGPK